MRGQTSDDLVFGAVDEFGVAVTTTRARTSTRTRLGAEALVDDESVCAPENEPSEVVFDLNTARGSERRLIGNLSDLSRQLGERRQERALEFEALLSAAPDAMIVATPGGEIILANSQVDKLFGYEPEELLGKRADLLLPERLRSRHVFKKIRALSERRSRGDVYAAGLDEEGIYALHRNGNEFPAEINLSPVTLSGGVLIIAAIRDVSHRHKLERQLRERTAELERQIASRERVEAELRMAHKLEAVGHLAAGIAHEITTPLQYVSDSMAYVREASDNLKQLVAAAEQLLDTGLPVDKIRNLLLDLERDYDYGFLKSELPRALRRAEEGLRRVTEIVESMRELAYPDDSTKELADINRALRVSLRLTRSEYKNVAFVETNFAPIVRAYCSPGTLTQAFVNLIVNATHAVKEKFGSSGKMGLIRLESRVEDGRAIVRISDNGTGIREEVQDRVYDPFFTTKPLGLGTGQGLPIARTIIVEGHGGDLKFDSRVGEGTTFEISIPTREDRGIEV